MSILQRPGFANQTINKNTQYVLEAKSKNVVKQLEDMFITNLQKSGHSLELMQSPQNELYRFAGYVVMNDEDLKKYFPDVTNPRKFQSRHLARLATLEDGENTIKAVQSKLSDAFGSVDRIREIAQALHGRRKSKGKTEDEEVLKTMEKELKWDRKLNPRDPVKRTTAKDITPDEMQRVDSAQGQISLASAISNMRLPNGETFSNLVSEYPQLNTLLDATDADDLLERILMLIDDDDEDLANIATHVYRKVKTDLLKGGQQNEAVKLTQKEINNLIQENYKKKLQYNFRQEEKYQ